MRLITISITCFFTCLFLATSLYAQSGASVKDVDMLNKNKIVLMEDYPHVFKAAQIIDVQAINNKHSRVSYTIADDYYEAVVNSNRKDLLLVAKCKQISLQQLPDIVKDSFKKSESGAGEIVRAFEVTTPASALFYRVDAYPAGTIKRNESTKLTSYFFDKLGHFKTPPY